jgi:hypothetical protein
MTAAALLERARADGVALALGHTGKLLATGEQAAVDRWLPEIRASKLALIACLRETAPQMLPVPIPEPDEAHRLWLITLPDGERFSSSFSPPATRAEVLAWHPAAVSLEPTVPALVSCGTCSHWRADTIGDGSGLGSCLADAAASRWPGSLWPRSLHRCNRREEVRAC